MVLDGYLRCLLSLAGIAYCCYCVGLGVSPLDRDGDPAVVITGITKCR